MSNVAVVGAGGFVGAALIESLVLDGLRVRAVVRGHRSLAGFCQFGSAVDVALADAEKVPALTTAFADIDTVVNVTTGQPAGIIRSTEAIHQACVAAGVRRFVHLSSAVVFGDVLQPTGDDDAPVSGHWMPYARAKAASEIWLRPRLTQGVDVTVLRPGIVWGVRSSHTLDLARTMAGKNGYLVGGGAGIFNGIYIDNLVANIRTVCDSPRSAPGFYNVGDAETVTWRQFFEAFGPALGCDPARMPMVSAEKFPWSKRAAFDAALALPGMNESAHWLKGRLPDGLKAQIRKRLEGAYSYDRHAPDYNVAPTVDREIWHLQRVRHKLPVDKFARTFEAPAPLTFEEGVRRTLAWLMALGMASEDDRGRRVRGVA